MRDYKRLQVFKMADALAIGLYRITRRFPSAEQFGLVSQLRRAAVSVGANIVEGASRDSRAEFVRFLSVAYASARELEFELSLSARLAYMAETDFQSLSNQLTALTRALRSLMLAIKRADA